MTRQPRVGSGVIRIDPLSFLAGCCTRRLNQAISVSYLSLTLPYHTVKTFYHLALRPLTGPMRIPELTVRLQNPQVEYSPGSIPTLGAICSQERAYSLELTY